jgi:hypothetical protein
LKEIKKIIGKAIDFRIPEEWEDILNLLKGKEVLQVKIVNQ